MEGPMSENAKTKLREWMLEVGPLVSTDQPFDIHFDELLGRGTSRSDMIGECASLFSFAVELLTQSPGQLVLILMIPITNSESMTTLVPSEVDIVAQVHPTPPSIYLVHRAALSKPERTERYQKPTSFVWIPTGDDRYFTCYKTWRAMDAPPEEGWVREVYVEFHTAPGASQRA